MHTAAIDGATMETDLAERLPEDVLADVLGRLPPRSLAAARCVCRAWHATMDARRLLDRNLLPLPFAGFFINFADLRFAEYYSRSSSTAAAISSDLLRFVPTYDVYVEDVCNGLVLLDTYVVNPATRRWASLPPHPPPPMGFENFIEQDYLMFDPAVSLHYQVLRFMHAPYASRLDASVAQQEWPPSPLKLNLFSSETTRWEETPFIRQGDALGTLADMKLAKLPFDRHHGVYWRGELYVHCHFVMRISLSNCTYQAIELPIDVDMERYPTVLLGRSEKGVYFAALDRQCRLQVWVLDESSSAWLPRHDSNLHHVIHMPPCQNHGPQTCRSWIMSDVNYSYRLDEAGNPTCYKETPVEEKLEWHSDSEDVSETTIGVHINEHITVLGFHPYKEIIFLSDNEYSKRGFAYHLDQSKLEDLGNMRPKALSYCLNKGIDQSFPYTPFRFEKFLDND